MFIKPDRHPLGNMEQAPGYSYLKFRGEVLAGDRNSGVIRTSQGLGSTKDLTLTREFSQRE